jgi:hypothetical protein
MLCPRVIVHRGAAGLLIANYGAEIFRFDDQATLAERRMDRIQKKKRMHPLPLTYVSPSRHTQQQPSRGPEMSGLHSHNEPLFRSLLSNVNNGI